MAKKYNLKLGVWLRFVRVFIASLAVNGATYIALAEQYREVLPMWLIPGLSFMVALAVAADKLIRELKG